ncbi:MAG: 6-phosphofructokinase [Spirochaetes bacterium]|nr:6-phosphofructokinase [Spirochaetota bacterium]
MGAKGNLIIGQSGGPTQVINQSLVGAVLEALKHDNIDGIYGMVNGVQGLLDEKIIDLRKEKKEDLEKVAMSPGAALGSCRYKPTQEDCEKIFNICKKKNIRYFFYIGGNDTAETANIIHDIASEEGYDLGIFHVPKTIDNDLRETDHCPGYGSASRYVSLLFKGDNLDNLSLKGIKLNIVMGRNAGWLTAAAALARENEGDGPHLVYVPERPVTMETMAKDIEKVYQKHGRALVAVSEGLRNTDGELMIKSKLKEQDSHGNVQLSGSGTLGDFLSAEIKAMLGGKLRVRADTLGYAQRAFMGVYSEVDAREARQVGEAAVRFAAGGETSGSVIIKRLGNGPDYAVEMGFTDLEKVARVTKDMPNKFVTGDNDVSNAFIEYLKPLVGDLPPAGRLNFHSIK